MNGVQNTIIKNHMKIISVNKFRNQNEETTDPKVNKDENSMYISEASDSHNEAEPNILLGIPNSLGILCQK